MADQPKKTPEQLAVDEQDIADALAEAKMAAEATTDQRTKEVEDSEFEAGAHWTAAEITRRTADGLPSEVVNQITGPILQVTNQPVPRIQVSPVGSGADPKTAEYWQGVLRRMENRSDAEQTYKWARWGTARVGRNGWRIRPDYETEDSTDQDVFIEPVDNWHSVYLDPRCRKLNGEDRKFGIIAESLLWKDFKAEYPHAEKGQLQDFGGVGDVDPDWLTSERVRVAERYYLVKEDAVRCKLADGRTVWKDPAQPYPPEQIVSERPTKRTRVKWMKFTAGEVLARADVPGTYIPIVEIYGQRRNINGKIEYRGLVRDARGPQRMVNFHECAVIHNVNLGSYQTVRAEAESIEGFEADYENPHLNRPSVQRYKLRDVGGKQIAPPMDVSPQPNIEGAVIAAQRASQHVRQVTGVPDVFSEERHEEVRVGAIKARERQRAIGTNNYTDGLASGVALTGKIAMAMYREILDVPRVIRIQGLDERPAMVIPYAGDANKAAAQQLEQQTKQQLDPQEAAALKGMFDVSVGDFDVTVKAGLNDQTAREQSFSMLTDVLPMLQPDMQAKLVPIWLSKSDAPGSQEAVKALRGDEDAIPPEVKQHVQQLEQSLQQAADIIKTDQVKQQAQLEVAKMNNDAKIELERMKLETEIALLRMKLEAEQNLALLKAKADQQQEREGRQSEMQAGAMERGHERGTLAFGALQAERTLEQSHEQALEEGEQSHQQAIEQGERGHRQALEQQAAKPQPTNGAGA